MVNAPHILGNKPPGYPPGFPAHFRFKDPPHRGHFPSAVSLRCGAGAGGAGSEASQSGRWYGSHLLMGFVEQKHGDLINGS